MTDLIERLREVEDWNYGALLHEAADEIERLTKERETFREAWMRTNRQRLDLKLENHNLKAEIDEICSSLFSSRGVEENDG